MVRVKICGIMDVPAALAAAEAGAQAIGLVFAPSRRRVTVDRAREIASALPPFITKVGVFVDDTRAHILEIADACRLDMLQFHGSESAEFCAGFRLPVIRAIRMRDRSSVASMQAYQVSAFLLDSFEPDLAGGTGKPFNWDLAVGLQAPAPLILAGGLTAVNVQDALETVHPFGVDVSSGVETDGRKDHGKIREFIARAHAWNGTR